MKQYYTVLNRQDFNSLYRYGQIKINANRFINKEKDFESELFKLFQNIAHILIHVQLIPNTYKAKNCLVNSINLHANFTVFTLAFIYL